MVQQLGLHVSNAGGMDLISDEIKKKKKKVKNKMFFVSKSKTLER